MNKECTWCGNELSEEEIASPIYEDGTCLITPTSGEIICDRCYHDEFEFTCYWCENYESNTAKEVLLIAEECGGLPAGLYRITEWPYFISNYFDMWWNKECFERLGPVPPGFTTDDGLPSGHLCLNCQERATPPRNYGNPERCAA